MLTFLLFCIYGWSQALAAASPVPLLETRLIARDNTATQIESGVIVSPECQSQCEQIAALDICSGFQPCVVTFCNQTIANDLGTCLGCIVNHDPTVSLTRAQMVMQDFQAECLSLGSVFSPVTVSATVTPTPSSTSAAPPRPKANSTSTGAVAGGVVGGIVAIAIIACCVLIILRRRRRAMIPDANSPTTMTYSVPVASPLSAAPRPDMLRYRSLNNPSNEYSIPATSPLPAASQHRDLNSNSSSTEYGETADTSSLPATIMLSPDPRRSRQHVTYLTKEREAFRRSAVNHTDVGSSNASSTQAGDSTVLVHKDGGRVQREIPPTYDSIEDF